jgi:hypothetical protein
MNTKLLKRWALGISGITSLASYVIMHSSIDFQCNTIKLCSGLTSELYRIRDYDFVVFVIFFIFLLFTAITYFLRKEIFNIWLPTGILYIAVSIIWSFNIKIESGSLLGSSPSLMTVYISFFFVCFSILLIALSYIYLCFNRKKIKR